MAFAAKVWRGAAAKAVTRSTLQALTWVATLADKRPVATGGTLRPSGRLRLAGRPDQVVRAVLAFDQAGIDRRRERLSLPKTWQLTG